MEERMTCLTSSRNIAQRQMKKKGLTPKDMMKIIDNLSFEEFYNPNNDEDELIRKAIIKSGLTTEQLLDIEKEGKKEYAKNRNEGFSSVGNCIKEIQAIASKYTLETIEEEEQCEQEFREYLLKQGYTRY